MHAALKAFLIETLGPAYEPVMAVVAVLTPFRYPGSMYWPFLLINLAVIVYVYLAHERNDAAPSFGGFLSFLVPRRVYTHIAAWVDLKFYVISTLVLRFTKLSAHVVAFAGLLSIGEASRRVLELTLGPSPGALEPSLIAMAGYTLLVTVAVDFAKWIAHVLQHKVPVLWEFHKVHHSPEVLTPLTNLRFHPVDLVVENFCTATLTGLVVGMYGYWYSGGITEISILGMGAVYAFAAIFTNLRHSHIPVHFGPRISKLLSSPAMHQIHHSSEARHFDKNFAVIFSLWDHLAGTNYIPARGEQYRMGIGEESARFRSVWALYFYPFGRAIRVFRSRELA
jgi:sterol desaturase/sphingolipid hydroxylase (fatty acid hydroxylase superfamily)